MESPEAVSLSVDPDATAVLRFWFEQIEPGRWFRKDADFDELVRQRFGSLTQRALAAELANWAEQAASGLALVLLLDQFTRQIWRGSGRAFSGDGQALAVAQAALERGWVAAEAEGSRRQFWLMPLMHSEDLSVQEAALPLFKRFTDPRTAGFAARHHDVIARFGRFPHRNNLLGRPSTPEELIFLAQPGSGF